MALRCNRPCATASVASSRCSCTREDSSAPNVVAVAVLIGAGPGTVWLALGFDARDPVSTDRFRADQERVDASMNNSSWCG